MNWRTQNGHRGPVRRWLGAPGSLSAKLVGAGRNLSVQVLSQGRQRMRWDETKALGFSEIKAGYVREVILRVDGQPVVFARSITVQAQSRGPWRSIRGLGSRPLADVLFRQAGMARTALHFSKLKPASAVRKHVVRGWSQVAGDALAPRMLPARRSVFRHRGAPLLVMEVFAAQQLPWCWPSSRSRAIKSVLIRKNDEN